MIFNVKESLRFPFRKDQLICDGPSKESRECNANDCPSWTPWSTWSQCSLTCGGGKSKRTRKCALPDKTLVPNDQCKGEPEETKTCNEKSCPELGPWSEWTQCSQTCGGGSQERRRECGLASRSKLDNPCLQPLREERGCNETPCPLFSPWSSWSACSVSCGGGNQTRTRKCVSAVPDNEAVSIRVQELYCEGKALQSQVKNPTNFVHLFLLSKVIFCRNVIQMSVQFGQNGRNGQLVQ